MEALSDLAALRLLTNQAGLISGEDTVNNWLGTVNAASGYKYVKPLTVGDTSTYGIANGTSGAIIGTAGASGDYIESVQFTVSASAASRVVLQDGAANATILNGGTGSAWSSGTPTAVTFGTNTTSLTLAAAQAYVNQFLIGTWTVNGFTVITARKILAATATTGVSGSFVTTLTIDSPVVGSFTPTALTLTAGALAIYPCLELVPNNTAVGSSIPLRMKSAYGGWRVFHDTGVSCIFTGKFT